MSEREQTVRMVALSDGLRGDTIIQERLQNEFTMGHPMHEMARYHLQAGGKCLRGLLALAEAESLGVARSRAMVWALACELLHNATLIHDDIQDQDPIRRGQPSLWKLYGTSQAINTGDLLIFRSFKLSASLGEIALTELLSSTAETLVRGQADELATLQPVEHSYWLPYLEMARMKTGTLFKLPVEGIHILANPQQDFRQAQAWLDLGVCYQIYDDIRDFCGLKQPGQKQKDFAEQRINALVAWLSKDLKNQDLISHYLAVANGSTEHEALTAQLSERVTTQKVIPQLIAFADKMLAKFKSETQLQTQKVILQFFNSAVQKGVEQNVSNFE